jgi:hypothetical protein
MVKIIGDTDFKLTPVEDRLHMVAGPNEGLPAHTREVERNLIGQVVPPGVLEMLDKVERLDQRLMLRRRAERERVR